jgi:hypothetical protein
VICLDTGCFVKLYYPETDSAKVMSEFISTDVRQKKLTVAMGLNLVTF